LIIILLIKITNSKTDKGYQPENVWIAQIQGSGEYFINGRLGQPGNKWFVVSFQFSFNNTISKRILFGFYFLA
jgi:hypothetical protein